MLPEAQRLQPFVCELVANPVKGLFHVQEKEDPLSFVGFIVNVRLH